MTPQRPIALALLVLCFLATSAMAASNSTKPVTTPTKTGNSTTGGNSTGPIILPVAAPNVSMTAGMVVPGTTITLSNDGTGFTMTGGVGGLSTFQAQIAAVRELAPGGATVVQEAAIAYGNEQLISIIPPWDKDIVTFKEYTQSIGIATPETTKFTWDYKAIKSQQPVETVSGSKVFILEEPGNVDMVMTIGWPVSKYTNWFQVCSLVSWSISSFDWPLFIDNVVLPGQNISAAPPITRTMRKNLSSQIMGFTLDGAFSFGYLYPSPAGYTFLSKNPWAMAGHQYFGPTNVTFTDASWTQDGSVTVCVTMDRTAEKIQLGMLIDADNGAAGHLAPSLALSLLLAVVIALARHLF